MGILFNPNLFPSYRNMAEGANRYPLSVLDNVFSSSIMTMGWPFKGTADVGKLDRALGQLVEKFPLLGGTLGKEPLDVRPLFLLGFCKRRGSDLST